MVGCRSVPTFHSAWSNPAKGQRPRLRWRSACAAAAATPAAAHRRRAVAVWPRRSARRSVTIWRLLALLPLVDILHVHSRLKQRPAALVLA